MESVVPANLPSFICLIFLGLVFTVGNGGARSLHYTTASKTVNLRRPNSIRQLTQQIHPFHLNDDTVSRISDRANVGLHSRQLDGDHDEEKKMVKKRAVPRTSSSLAITTAIPSEYITVVTLGISMKAPNRSIDDVVSELRNAFAYVLKWPVRNIRVDKISLAGNVIGLYFLKSGMTGSIIHASDLIPARDVLQPQLLKSVQLQAPELNVTNIMVDHGIYIKTYTIPLWTQPFFPYVTAAICLVVLLLLILILYLCCCRMEEKMAKEEDEITNQQIFYPTLKPEMMDPLTVQPDSSPVFIAQSSMPVVQTQPTRVKAKGLLESRRGSNASLTIDLNPSPDTLCWTGTPPKETSGLEFLLSAGNRLSRRDLRNAVKMPITLYEEFWEIPMNHPEKVSVAGSGMKNRYKTIIPNEHSRVILPDEESDPLSSYINANYIRGYEGEPNAYIATQGPMSHTIVDFWRLVWYEKSPIIVMITKLKEKNKPKCENYLPERYGIFGDIEVFVEKIIEKNGYILRHLTLRCHGECLGILHFWYTSWPDHKPPDNPRVLVELIKEVDLRRYKNNGVTPKGPVIVHCSAGIGRTGCFVGASIGVRQLREEHSVDVLGIVCSMRLDRGGMIQTHEQYEFIHQILCEYERELEEVYPTESQLDDAYLTD
ncbi:tyrosine-protein phosphatase non-receptor type 7-like [Gigantopelta aegis]|uniref:tyrosine-protein phosphatase non-receptor type 7-like n=1 Tax=Gigantopelta aegis TaxID=1735272 RepID=UPI001B889F10|nr:tyrosine-protein phosphatase non-receptor type 7-like [Gigantopelta aegis]